MCSLAQKSANTNWLVRRSYWHEFKSSSDVRGCLRQPKGRQQDSGSNTLMSTETLFYQQCLRFASWDTIDVVFWIDPNSLWFLELILAGGDHPGVPKAKYNDSSDCYYPTKASFVICDNLARFGWKSITGITMKNA